MTNSLTTELEATTKRLKIISDNTGDDNISKLANECVMSITQMSDQVKQILKSGKLPNQQKRT